MNALGKGWVQGKHRRIFLIRNDRIAMCCSKDRKISCFKDCSCPAERAGEGMNGGHAGKGWRNFGFFLQSIKHQRNKNQDLNLW